MASKPPGKCCFEHVVAEGTPRGKMIKIEESMYFSSTISTTSSRKTTFIHTALELVDDISKDDNHNDMKQHLTANHFAFC